jgi:hypothetical protein
VALALRARLAAFMVLALLVTGMAGIRPAIGEGAPTMRHAAAVAVASLQAVPPRGALAHSRAGSQLARAGRLESLNRRPSRHEELQRRLKAPVWADATSCAPGAPRFFFRKIPSDESADADADAPCAPSRPYHSRAPPALA